ncbi:MAG TPA: ankyrin repeat domain-containing protein [Gammaproteobacteria bacterium]|nr:ankyrin repeat domain-containing protein [Gammaproteobacteria bacterium]
MLSDFENKLYQVAKVAGFDSIDETHEVLVRHSIEWYLMEMIWKRTPRVKNLPSSSPLIQLLPPEADPEANVLEIVKTKLDLNLYTLNDDRVENLVDHIRKDNADALHQALEVEPELLHRRNRLMRSLLHEAVVQRKTWAAELLLKRGASLHQRNGSGFNTLELAIQSGSISLMVPLFYQRISQCAILQAMIACNYHEAGCIDVYHAKAQCVEPVTPTQEISLLHLAMEKRYFQLVKILVLNGASPNIPDSDGVTPLYNHAIEEMRSIQSNFSHRAQVVFPGFVSFLLAAGARPEQPSQNKQPLLEDLQNITKQAYGNFAVAGAEITCQCQLAMGEFPVIILKQSDYDSLKAAGLLVADNVVYVVLEAEGQGTIHYQKNGFPQTLTRRYLSFFEKMDWLIALLYPEFSTAQVKPFLSFGEFVRRYLSFEENYVNYIFNELQWVLDFFKKTFNLFIKAQPMHWDELFKDEAQMIQQLEKIYSGRPIRLDDALVHDMLEAAREAKHTPFELYTYIYCHLQLDTTPENIKQFLYRSTFFVKSCRFKDSVVNQVFSGELTFRQILSEAGIALKENYLFKKDSVEREAYGWVKLAEKNKGAMGKHHSLVNPTDSNKPISELDILKGIKKVYFYKIKNTINHPKWKDTHVAIRDSLALGSSTLFLNVIRTNSHMDQLKDTDTYLEICKLMQGVGLSVEAKAELTKRVQGQHPSYRDLVMYLALVCDFEQDKANFIRVCCQYLLSDAMSPADKKALNDALRLLSQEEHNQLRDRLVAVSADPSLYLTLKNRLPKKNCAFIEIIRTSEEDRKVINTQKFKDLVKELSKPMVEVVEKEENRFHLPTHIMFFKPDLKRYSANFDVGHEATGEVFFTL